jgi:hypothetical protein
LKSYSTSWKVHSHGQKIRVQNREQISSASDLILTAKNSEQICSKEGYEELAALFGGLEASSWVQQPNYCFLTFLN